MVGTRVSGCDRRGEGCRRLPWRTEAGLDVVAAAAAAVGAASLAHPPKPATGAGLRATQPLMVSGPSFLVLAVQVVHLSRRCLQLESRALRVARGHSDPARVLDPGGASHDMDDVHGADLEG